MSLTIEHPSLDTIRANLAEFKRVMGTNRAPSEADMVAQQKAMLGTLKTIFRQEGDVFTKGADIFAAWVRDNIKGCMSAASRFRGMHLAKEISKEDHSAMVLVVNLFCMVSDGRVRQTVLDRFDMGRLDKFWTSGNQSEKLRSYFSH